MAATTDLPAFDTLLLTGAAGTLGRVLADPLRPLCRTLRRSDLAQALPVLADPGALPCDLADAGAVMQLMQGVQAVVHLGGVSVEGPWEPILQANIRGLHNLYEAARRQGTKRIVFASSNHVTGCRAQGERTHPADPPRPDGNYGLSKLFGEGIASLYWDRYGIETVCLRIGSSFPEPRNRRMLATWMSYDDLERLVVASLTAPVVGHSIIYGMGDNTTTWWDNTLARHIGYRPQDSSDPFREAVYARTTPPDLSDPAAVCQGGAFVTAGPFESK